MSISTNHTCRFAVLSSFCLARRNCSTRLSLSTENTRFPLAKAQEQAHPLLTEEKGREERRAFPPHLATNTTELVTGSQRPPACARPCERCQINLHTRTTPFMSSLTHLQRRQIPSAPKPGRPKIDNSIFSALSPVFSYRIAYPATKRRRLKGQVGLKLLISFHGNQAMFTSV